MPETYAVGDPQEHTLTVAATVGTVGIARTDIRVAYPADSGNYTLIASSENNGTGAHGVGDVLVTPIPHPDKLAHGSLIFQVAVDFTAILKENWTEAQQQLRVSFMVAGGPAGPLTLSTTDAIVEPLHGGQIVFVDSPVIKLVP